MIGHRQPRDDEGGQTRQEKDRKNFAAARLFDRGLTLEPTNPAILAQAAEFAANLSRTNEAIALSEYLVARDPINPVGHLYLGWWYLFAGRLDEAIAAERTVLRLSPGYILAQFAIGVALLQKGEPAEALAAMRLEPAEHMRLNGLVWAVGCELLFKLPLVADTSHGSRNSIGN